MKIILKEIKSEYSYAKETANFINSNLREGVLACSHIPISSAIIPYTKVDKYLYYSPQLDKYFTYTIWDNQNEMQNYISINIILDNINKNFEGKKIIYFIYCYNWTDEELQYFLDNTSATEIFVSGTNSIKEDEKYIIYKLYNS